MKFSTSIKFLLCIILISIQLNHMHSTQFVNNINILKSSAFGFYPTTQLQCSSVKTNSTSSHSIGHQKNNNSPRGIQTNLVGPSLVQIKHRHRVSLFAQQSLTPPRHLIINSIFYSENRKLCHFA